MKKLWSFLVLACSMSLASMGQDLAITSFPGNGMLTWAYPTNGVTGYRVEWASQAGGPWTDTWDNLCGIAPTGVTMAAVVPMFYRVVAEMIPSDYLVIDLSAGPSALSYQVSYLTNVPAGGWTDEYKTTKLVLRLIPATASAFTMGAPADETGGGSLDETQHQVTLTHPFYIGVFEVTQRQWERVMGNWPSWFTNSSYRETRPVEMVSYDNIRGTDSGTNWPASNSVDTNSFMGRLRARTGQVFDLPTESQWEYAGRAGTTTALNSGYNLTNTESDVHMSEVGRYWFNGGDGGDAQNGDTSAGTAKAGSYLPNAWGLYDIHGNVWEWCLDWKGDYPGTVSDPKGAASGASRVYRSGGWYSYASSCRVANRSDAIPDAREYFYGFRAALPTGQ